jgi:hypothetical protein
MALSFIFMKSLIVVEGEGLSDISRWFLLLPSLESKSFHDFYKKTKKMINSTIFLQHFFQEFLGSLAFRVGEKFMWGAVFNQYAAI